MVLETGGENRLRIIFKKILNLPHDSFVKPSEYEFDAARMIPFGIQHMYETFLLRG